MCESSMTDGTSHVVFVFFVLSFFFQTSPSYFNRVPLFESTLHFSFLKDLLCPERLWIKVLQGIRTIRGVGTQHTL